MAKNPPIGDGQRVGAVRQRSQTQSRLVITSNVTQRQAALWM